MLISKYAKYAKQISFVISIKLLGVIKFLEGLLKQLLNNYSGNNGET